MTKKPKVIISVLQMKKKRYIATLALPTIKLLNFINVFIINSNRILSTNRLFLAERGTTLSSRAERKTQTEASKAHSGD